MNWLMIIEREMNVNTLKSVYFIGAGGIGIVRVSGPGALPILEKLFAPAGKGGYKPWILRRGRVQDTEGNTLDDSLAVFMPGPKTFTGEDVAEFQCHGGPALLAAVLEACLCAGARLAERASPGELVNPDTRYSCSSAPYRDSC